MKRRCTAIVLAAIMAISLCACRKSNNSDGADTPKVVPDSNVSTQIETENVTKEASADVTEEASVAVVYEKTYEEEEMAAATALGIIPDKMNLSGEITGEEFISLLRNMIELYGGDINIFNNKIISSYDMTQTIYRRDAAFGFYLAAEAMGFDTRYTNGIGGLWIRDETKDEIFESPMFTMPETATIIVDDYDEQDYPPALAANLFCVTQGSLVSKNSIMTTDDDSYLNQMKKITAKDAVIGAWRLYTSAEKPNYVTLEEAANDTNTIPAELFDKDSTLPEISYGNIPKYNAVTYQVKANAYGYGSTGWVDEDLIHALSDSGVNFISAWIDFSTLQYPDFVDGQINLNELEEWDKLISWCMEYDVHICIEMTGVPNHGGYPRGLGCYDPAIFSFGGLEGFEGEGGLSSYIKNHELRKPIQEYWELIAKRYANVPTKYLSFNLEVEIGLNDEQEYVDTYLPLAEAIRSYNDDRVVFSYANVGKVFDGLAAYGYPLAWSFYSPGQLTLSGENENYPYYDAKWPTYNLNGILTGSGKETESTLLLNLKSEVTSIKIHARNTMGQDTPLRVKSDDNKLSMKRTEDENDWYFLETELPKDASQLRLSVSNDTGVEFDAIFLTLSDKTEISLIPYQFNNNPKNKEIPVLTVATDGTVTSNRELNFESLVNENDNLGEYLKIAEKYGVGIIVSEWGIASNVKEKDTDTLYNYMKEIDQGLDELGITAASTNAPDVSSGSVILSKRCLNSLYYIEGEDCSFLTESGRYKALDYSSKYYIDTYLAKMLYGYSGE